MLLRPMITFLFEKTENNLVNSSDKLPRFLHHLAFQRHQPNHAPMKFNSSHVKLINHIHNLRSLPQGATSWPLENDSPSIGPINNICQLHEVSKQFLELALKEVFPLFPVR